MAIPPRGVTRTVLLFGYIAVNLATFAAQAHAATITAAYASSITSDPNAAAIESTINQAVQFYDQGIFPRR